MKRFALIIALLWANPAMAEGPRFDGNSYYELCDPENPRGEVTAGWCLGTITGIWFGYMAGVNDLKTRIYEGAEDAQDVDLLNNSSQQVLDFCLEIDLHWGQMQSVLHKFLREHPERRHDFLGTTFMDSAREVFPCD